MENDNAQDPVPRSIWVRVSVGAYIRSEEDWPSDDKNVANNDSVYQIAKNLPQDKSTIFLLNIPATWQACIKRRVDSANDVMPSVLRFCTEPCDNPRRSIITKLLKTGFEETEWGFTTLVELALDEWDAMDGEHCDGVFNSDGDIDIEGSNIVVHDWVVWRRRNDRLLTAELIRGILGRDAAPQLAGVQAMRKLLCKSGSMMLAIDRVIATGTVPRLIELLRDESSLDIKSEVLWVLTNITSSPLRQHVGVVVDAGAIEALVDLLSSPDERSCKNAIWPLGNIVENVAHRDRALRLGALDRLLALLASPSVPLRIARDGVYTLGYFCGKPAPSVEQLGSTIPTMVQLTGHEDEEVYSGAYQVLAQLCGPDHVQQLRAAAPGLRLLARLEDAKTAQAAALIIAALVDGCVDEMLNMVALGVLPAITRLILDSDVATCDAASRVVSRMAAGGTVDVVQALFAADVISALITALGKSPQHATASALDAVLAVCSPVQTMLVIEHGYVEGLCEVLRSLSATPGPDGPRDATLQALVAALETGAQAAVRAGCMQSYSLRMAACGGRDLLEALQHASAEVNATATLLAALHRCMTVMAIIFAHESRLFSSSYTRTPNSSSCRVALARL
eukprot:m.201748 g.201748  ORF g.201748 m.201748 type:complete len:622 (+) comp10105_c0_seq16:2177-4042(+)